MTPLARPSRILQTIVHVLVYAIAVGMILRAKRPGWADRARAPMRRIASLLFGIVVVIMLISDPEPVLAAAPIAGLPAIALSLAVLLLGYGASRAARTSRQDALTISVEIIVQNVPLATLIVFNILERAEFLAFIVVYAIVLLPIALAWAFGFRALGGLSQQSAS